MPFREERPAEELRPDAANFQELLERFRPRLERMLAVRLDPRLARRVDLEDVLQEVLVTVVRRRGDYLARRPMPFFLWVRAVAGQILVDVHRRHLGSARRDAAREVELGMPTPSVRTLAGALVDPGPTPTKSLTRLEALERVSAALERMDEADREVLVLRYFEGLSNEESAAVLGLTPSGAKKRHVRALTRLRSALPRGIGLPTP
jgi:RNA polymerase sigma-70 factor (ECF subfamily)